MSKNRGRFYAILAIVFVLFSVIAFAILFRNDFTFWVSYAFSAVAILLQVYAWPKAFDFEGHDVKSKFYGFPIARVSTIYLAVQLIASLIFMVLGKAFPFVGRISAIVGVLLLGLTLIGLISVGAARDEVVRQETVKKTRTDIMKTLQVRSQTVASLCSDPEAKKALQHLAEEIRYSDPVSNDALAASEAKIAEMLDTLQSAVADGRFSEIPDLCKNTEILLEERNKLCKLTK